MTETVTIAVGYDAKDFARLGKDRIIKDAIKTLFKNVNKKLINKPNQANFTLVITGTYDKSKCGSFQ